MRISKAFPVVSIRGDAFFSLLERKFAVLFLAPDEHLRAPDVCSPHALLRAIRIS